MSVCVCVYLLKFKLLLGQHLDNSTLFNLQYGCKYTFISHTYIQIKAEEPQSDKQANS